MTQALFWALLSAILPILGFYLVQYLKSLSQNQTYQAILVALGDEGKRIYNEIYPVIQEAFKDGVLSEEEKSNLKNKLLAALMESKDALVRTLAPKIYEQLFALMVSSFQK